MPSEDRIPASRPAKLLALLLAARTLWRTLSGRERHPVAPEPEFDPSKRDVPSNRRAETIVAVLLLLAALFGFAFTGLYIALGTNTQLLGFAIGCALALVAAAAIIAGRFVVPQETHVEQRDTLLVESDTEDVVALIEAGGEGISRRALLTGAGGLAGAAVLTAAASPIASLGPTLDHIHDTPWSRGVRLVDDQGRPYLANEIQVGAFYTALPEHGDLEQLGAGLIMVRLPSELIKLPPARGNWAPQGIMAYSKICPHAGCAISLYRYPTDLSTSVGPAFTCPCHYSTFSPGEGGRLLFGPAGRALPQLPLMIDEHGYLIAAGPFHEDVGPSWWNVHRAQS